MMHSRRRLVLAALIVPGLVTAGRAASLTATLGVSALVTRSCRAEATMPRLRVACDPGAVYSVGVDAGRGPQPLRHETGPVALYDLRAATGGEPALVTLTY